MAGAGRSCWRSWRWAAGFPGGWRSRAGSGSWPRAEPQQCCSGPQKRTVRFLGRHDCDVPKQSEDEERAAKPIPRWVWLVAAVVALLLAGAGYWHYSRGADTRRGEDVQKRLDEALDAGATVKADALADFDFDRLVVFYGVDT